MQNYLPACKIVSTHGVRGEMKALPLCDGAQFLAKFKRLYAAANGSGEVALRGVRAQGNMLLVKLAGVEDMDAARAQVGKTYYFAKADAKLPEGRYFIDDLIGCTVLHADDGRTLGIVAKVDHPGVQDIYIVRDAAGKGKQLPLLYAYFLRAEFQCQDSVLMEQLQAQLVKALLHMSLRTPSQPKFSQMECQKK